MPTPTPLLPALTIPLWLAFTITLFAFTLLFCKAALVALLSSVTVTTPATPPPTAATPAPSA